MNDERCLFGEKPNLEGNLLYWKARARDAKMDGEENTSGSNKRVKRNEVKVDTEDDEPIGSLFKLKKSRNPKKVKSGLNIGKVEKVEARAEESTAKDEGLGEMDDTLASFYMKLKRPKIGKDRGSGTRKSKGTALNGGELLSKQVEGSQTCSGGGSDLLLDRTIVGKEKHRGKKPRLEGMSKKTENHSKLGDLDQESGGVQRSQKKSRKKLKEVSAIEENCTQYSDENSDFSLSGFLQKVQSSSARKARSSTSQKKKRRNTQASGDKFSGSPDVVLQHVSPRLFHGSYSASRVPSESVKAEGGLSPPEKSAILQEATETQRSCERMSQSSVPVQELAYLPKAAEDGLIPGSGGTSEEQAIVQEVSATQKSCERTSRVSELVQELAYLPKVVKEVTSSNGDGCSISTERILGESIPASHLPKSYTDSFLGLRRKHTAQNNDESDRWIDIAKEHPGNLDALQQPCGADSKNIPSPLAQESCYPTGEKPVGEMQGLTNGLMQCSNVKENRVSETNGDESSKISENLSSIVSTFREASDKSGANSTEPSDAHNTITGCFSNAAGEPFRLCAMPNEKSLGPCIDDDISNRLSAGKCDENGSDQTIFLNQPSEDAFGELSSKNSSFMPCKTVSEAFRLDEFAQLSGEIVENPVMHSVQESCMVCISPKMEEDPKVVELGKCFYGNLKDSDLKPSSCAPHLSSSPGSLKKDEIGSGLDGSFMLPCNNMAEALLTPVSKQMEETPVSNNGLHSTFLSSDGIKDIDFDPHIIHKEEIRTTADASVIIHLSDSFSPTYAASPQNKESYVASVGSPAPSQDSLPFKEEVITTCSQSTMLEADGSFPEDAGTAFHPEIKDAKLKATQRAVRKSKKRRHGDMAYEGDTDWDFLTQEQGVFGNRDLFNGDMPSKEKDKSKYSNMAVETEHCGAAAVAVGLKARTACPFEKIKFKEILKRRGGLQEYLECRNSILGLWSKDTSCILLLSDCGVTGAPSDNDPPRASFIREIYDFLDHNGYINVGIASEKEKAESSAKAHNKLFEESKTEESSGPQVTDSDDGVPFVLGQVKYLKSLTAKKIDMFFNNDISQTTKSTEFVPSMGSESCLTRSEEHIIIDEQRNSWIDANLPNRTADFDAVNKLSSEVVDDGPDSVVGPVKIKDSHGIQSAVIDSVEGKDNMQCNSEGKKRIIVIGAGPAGLTAARHLQRQGFSVTILEARNRLGGRVYTDRSSLSVPVDLGASIITGVEADVATERRPDPSSLVCSQLGLELTVLNSDCPLYDIVTGQKVPPKLDEALEAEFNGLLDDMVVLVEQKGERAMRLSLEDGLEYGLKKRRTAQSRPDAEELELEALETAAFDIGADGQDKKILGRISSQKETLSPLERRVMNWHFANLEYGCAALLNAVSLPNWNQDDVYGGFGGAHCMIKGGYSNVIESMGKGLHIHLNHVVTEVSYSTTGSDESESNDKIKVSTSNGSQFVGDAVLITVPLGCLKANTIKFSPSLPDWKQSSIRQLGFGVLNKVVLEFPEVFWDDSVDYFGATAEETDLRGQCFMFWNVKKTAGAPVLIALLVGKAALDGETMSSTDHVDHALKVLRKLFGSTVPDPVASVVTNWGQDPFSRGAYSYVAVGASGEDYDILGRPVENCLFFAGEATCKEHPDTVGGAMVSGLREAVRIIDILNTGKDYIAEVEAMEAAQIQTESERNEVRDILKRLEAVKLSSALYKSSFDGSHMLTKETLLQDMFHHAKTTSGRLHLAKELLNLPVEALKSFAGTREGLGTLNSWILDSMGKDGTQLLRHCVRLLVLVSTNLRAVRLSGIGKTVKDKVCVHTSRDIRAVASQLVSMWIEVFRKEKAANGGFKLLRQTTIAESSKNRSAKAPNSGKFTRPAHGASCNRGNLQVPSSPGKDSPSKTNNKKTDRKLDTIADSKSEGNSLHSQEVVQGFDSKAEDNNVAISEEEAAVFAAAEAARAAALAAAEAYASSEAERCALRELPKIPSFHKFARREQYAQMDESDFRRKWSGGVLGRQECLSEIDSRNCKVQNWSVDFSAACANLDTSRMSGDNYTQQSQSNEVGYQMNLREHSGESAATDSRITKAWVDSAGSGGVKDYQDIERWQSQAAAVDPDFFNHTIHIRDEEDSSAASKPVSRRYDKGTEGSAASQAAENQVLVENQTRGVERIKKAVVDYVGSLLMPLYKARKIDREGYKSILKKSATKVMEQTTDAEKAMNASEFLDFKRKNKIRAFVDKLIEKHMSTNRVKT